MKRTGVFICHCGINIAGTVDVKKVAKELSNHTGVVHSEEYIYMCSDPGQNLIIEAIKENQLDSVVVACCSPTLHETTFRNTVKSAGINPFQCEIANIREQCSWVHKDMEKATEKAIKLTKSAVERVHRNESLDPISIPVTRRALVVGGGIAGIQSALDLANSGYEVILVERSPSIGGHMIQLSETFPTLDCSQCILTPKMVEVSKHPKIKLLTYSEIQDISGYVGNFKVKILKKPTYVDPDKCTLCDECTKVCPVVVPNEFDLGLTGRRAVYMPFPQAIPATYTLDIKSCPGLLPIACGKCADVCEPEAIDYDMKPEIVEEEVGAIIVATGFDLYDKELMAEYGHGKYADVLDGLQFERLCSASGPTTGKILRPSDHKEPKEVVFIQCVGSRDPELHCAYCSKICCMYTAKHAMLYKHHVPDGQAYIFYIDIRSGGKGYEEFVQRAVEEDGALYLRGKVSKIFEDKGKIKVWGVDTLSGKDIEIDADMVVLATAMRPSEGAEELAKKLKIALDKDGFLSEAHPKLRPVESVTPGMFLAGAAQAPKDIPEAVAQASGAAAKAIAILSQERLFHAPTVAKVNVNLCTGCGMCVHVCPYDSLSLKDGKAEVNEVLCEGCGTCSATCLRAAIEVKNLTPLQVNEMIGASLGG
ncbi:MAG: CoB--CoM heterodisulfide reductase iron-sulfur subunit A family protein [Candidatus Aminicenantes bacterium]|nr:CoB--CoM heterodisulfide reductase iron-sulfur subunit A family protein [Candidatus Aminicenantes bacterium]MBL7082360.1 CoB--CoM heterodisulfide reductase iron-sulfur subunit A family protein [Candidatus Aminicenantes bacterium]